VVPLRLPMIPVTTIQFVLHLVGASTLGALVGLERQLHQRMAGSRTNALVAAGASAFVMAGSLISGDPSAPSRMAPFVVSGVGFLGAGVIFKDGASVHGLNTAATIWCSAAMGVLTGLNSLHLASILAAIVILTNIALRPLLGFLHLASPAAESVAARFEIVITCRTVDETHLRALLLTLIASTTATLRAIDRADERETDRTRLRTEISTPGQQRSIVEEIALRLSIEPGVTSLSWSGG
jgi:putative Mg2+ transporter-C (MgtC) family protein